MSIESVVAEAPSNIALIKYMGKILNQDGNLSTNASFSWTLDHLKTRVKLSMVPLVEMRSDSQFIWKPMEENSVEFGPGWYSPELSETGQNRFCLHADRVLRALCESLDGEIPKGNQVLIQSANNFPSDCGLASSASSFAALTRAVASFVEKNMKGQRLTGSFTPEKLSDLSRQGSGSSCRSFFSPWAVWDHNGASQPSNLKKLPRDLHHLAVIVEDGKKSVSSSEAHRLVQTSLLFSGREKRAESRLKELLEVLAVSDSSSWNRACDTVWAEFWDMHALFETSQTPFGYMSAKSVRVLEWLRHSSTVKEMVQKPMVTMDAGPNIHILLMPGSSPQIFSGKLREFLKSEDGFFRGAKLIDASEFST